MSDTEIKQEKIDQLYEKMNKDALNSGYNLNTDFRFTKALIRGLLVNEERYGYMACPCRLASGVKEEDLDIVCPCDYRDTDLDEYDACYCGLYVSSAIIKGEKKFAPIPERRVPLEARQKVKEETFSRTLSALPLPVWRCAVCGYLCARVHPPEICPICKVKKDRFERFI